ncbi:MAG: hypothetical protein D6681_22310 [Calditrichaeota bacterium]|nr:MAG: hypothetical protein D6681_22310 [Calditrichota bacterium]
MKDIRVSYILLKKWSGFLQKYNLRTQLRNVRKLFVFLFVVWLWGSLLTILSQWLFAREFHSGPTDYLKYLWIVIIELVSGFDIPESIPLHTVSLIISIGMLIMGLVVVGLFTGQIISMFVHVLQRADFFPEKPEKFQFDRPILICGVNSKLNNIIRLLRKSELSRGREIVIIDPTAHQLKKLDDPDCRDIWYVRGDPANRSVLQKALGRHDNRVIILSPDSPGSTNTSSIPINTALAIEAFDERVHTVVEIPEARNVAHFRQTLMNDWVSLTEFSARLIAQTALQPGMAEVFSRLLGDMEEKHCARIQFSALPLASYLVGKSYREIATIIRTDLLHLHITPIGFAKYIDPQEKKRLGLTLRNTNYFIQVNPINGKEGAADSGMIRREDGHIFFTRETILERQDMLIYLGDKQIDFNQFYI